MSKTILVVAAHTDDEALGCGGTLARHVAEGDVVHAVFLADGVSSRPAVDAHAADQRAAAAEAAHAVLGITSTTYLGLPDNRLDSLPLLDIVQALEAVIAELSPEVVYTHHHGDLNIDHRLTHQAAMTACRPVPGRSVREIYAFEVMSSTEWQTLGLSPFMPQLFVDITDYLDCKLEALAAYQLEMRPKPHSRSLEHISALALHRGHSVGLGAAEGFMIIRLVQ